ncbi:MAG: hypothetical protein DRJ67_05935 [Thermoprotei archaeon]|nr:MAG: hypothetical protein DRJ67_05935 [Thermoprotei archaeon]
MNQVLAVLLLIVVSTAAAVSVYLWASSVAAQWGEQVQAAPSSNLKIQAVKAVKSGGRWSITTYVQNLGGGRAHVVKAIITEDGNAVADADVSAYVEPGDIIRISFTVSGLSSGHTYTLKLIAEDGGFAQYTFRA